MKKLAQWSINNRVAVNLIMMFIIVAGLLTVTNMRREMFPQFALDMINVSVPYPGASPAEVEEGICIKIEEKIKGIENITRTYSSSREGLGSVTVELDKDADVQKIMDDIKNEVDLIDTFPDRGGRSRHHRNHQPQPGHYRGGIWRCPREDAPPDGGSHPGRPGGHRPHLPGHTGGGAGL
jgi:multidrug efflux pump subunit AcrB